MREIKFRVFDTRNKKMITDGVCYQLSIGVNGSIKTGISEDILMQFTGLIDKNGKEVYEGDIIKWKETRFWNKEQEQKGVAMPRFFKSEVVYDDAEFLVSSTQEFDTPLCCFFRGEDIHNPFDYKAEIIGNIYENPELLQSSE